MTESSSLASARTPDLRPRRSRDLRPRLSPDLRRRRRPSEAAIRVLLFLSGAFSILTTVGILYELGKEALLFRRMQGVNLSAILASTRWQPHTGEFGI